MQLLRLSIAFILEIAMVNMLFAQQNSSQPPLWGDQANGTYINPILKADYSDPDVIRVDSNYYMVCSEFHFMGMPILHSVDLLNWTIIGRVYDCFDFENGFDSNERYGDGSWAPSIRYHKNKFWVYFCTPSGGLYMSTAVDPAGHWEPLHQVIGVSGWEDPCPFWDDDGKAYLGHSKLGGGPIIIHRMSADGRFLLDEGKEVYNGPVAEGTKIYKINGDYYMSIPEGGVATGWQTILRSDNIYGPYEKKVVLEQGTTTINGPHQGALVDTPEGDWWFLHFQSLQRLGRVVHLQPVVWQNRWPLIGIDVDRNGVGEPVYVWKKPQTSCHSPILKPQTSDDFESDVLGFQWSWNHNPVEEAWSLTKTSGSLTLDALQANDFASARNTLTQKIMGDSGVASVFLDGRNMADGQQAGLCLMGRGFAKLGLKKKQGKWYLFSNIDGTSTETKLPSPKVYLRVCISSGQKNSQFSYSRTNKNFMAIGDKFEILEGHWKGPKIGLFTYNELKDEGRVIFDSFIYQFN